MTFTLPADTTGLTRGDLRRLTNASLNQVQLLLRGCVDSDVTFVPSDPDANDPSAVSADESQLAWTLGHLIMHVTASAEEAAALAAELARGVAYHGRSRREVPWESVTTLAQCRSRLDESRRMRCGSLEMWPDHPDPDTRRPWQEGTPGLGAIQCFLVGLQHEADHVAQLREVIRQARTYRRQQNWLGRWQRRRATRRARRSSGSGVASAA